MSLTIKEKNHVITPVDATTSAVVSSEIELVSERNYTIISSPLQTGERVGILVYDYSTGLFNQMYIGGVEVYMTQFHHILTFQNVSCVIKIDKGITANPVGVSIASR